MTEDEANGNVVLSSNVQTGNPIPSAPPLCDNAVLNVSPLRSSSSSDGSNISESKKKSDFESKKLNRGISRATDNVNLVSQARSEILVDTCDQEFCLETPIHTFTLPDLSSFPDNFRAFLEKDLIALSTQISLEQANRLNWWTSHCQRLWPLSTSGDGNCLLHAASLGMWGFHDRLLTLRKALHSHLAQSPRREALWRRWRRQQSMLNALAGLVYSEVEWRHEWNAIVSMASSEPRPSRRLSVQSNDHGSESSGAIYESLEEIHVLALAHVLKRPIIVIADTVLKDMNGEALAPIPFGGIYLPLECPATECHRSPLLLAYDGGHFSALVPMDSTGGNGGLSSAIPLCDISGELLPIQFSVDPGQAGSWTEALDLSHCQNIDLLSTYLDIIRIDTQQAVSPGEETKNGLLGSIGKSVGQKLRLKLSRSNSQRQGKTLLCAVLHSDHRHEYYDVMIKNYLETAKQRFQLQQDLSQGGEVRYGAGRSQFYTEVDLASHDRVSQLPAVRALTNPDQTLYLCKSTFYQRSEPCQTSQCSFFGSPHTQNLCSKCYQQLLVQQSK